MNPAASLLGFFLPLLPLAAGPVSFGDNFNSAPAGSVLGGRWILNVPHHDITLEYRITADGSNLFGQGPGNRFLALTDSVAGSPNLQFSTFFDTWLTAGRVSFRFHDPQLSETSGNAVGLQLRLGTSDSSPAGNTTSAFGVFLHDGALYTNAPGSAFFDKHKPLATYSFSAPHTLSIVFNNGHDTRSYTENGAKHVLAPGTMHLWLDGALVASDLGRFNNYTAPVPVANLTINGQSSGRFFVMYLDDFVIQPL